MTQEKLIVNHQIEINASKENIWEELTNPNFIKQWDDKFILNPIKVKKMLLCFMFLISFSMAYSQTEKKDSTSRRQFIGSSLFMLGNLVPNNPPSYYILNYGYSLTPKDVIVLEVLTWKYHAPLGIPYTSPSYEKPSSQYPGYIRGYGVGLVYKRFLWQGIYSAVHVTPIFQKYLDSNNIKIQNGFQLWSTLRFGYHLKLFKNRCFIEPSVAFNYWPINTNLPKSFSQEEKKWPNYFLFEPGLFFGVKF